MENKSFEEKQAEFRKNLRDIKSKIDYTPEKEIDVPSFISRDINERRYTAQRGTMHNAKEKNKKSNLKKKIIVGLAIGTIAIGAAKGGSYIREVKNPPITIEQALKSGKSLQELGINANIKNQINEIENKLKNENITNSELIELASQIESIQFDVIKGKLSEQLGVEKNNIKISIYTDSQDATQFAKIQAEKNAIDKITYIQKDFLSNGTTMSDNIKDFIYDIGDIQELKNTIQLNDIDRDKIINMYKDKVENINEFAAGEISLDKDGNIELKKTRVKDLEKENSKSDEGFEPGDE